MLNLSDIESYFPENVRTFKENILREYIQCKILNIIFSSKIGEKISFIGGTALRIIYNTERFSLDLDFDNFNLSEAEFIEASEIVKSNLELEGFKVEIQTLTEKNTFHYYIKFPGILFDNKISPHINQKTLIKVDTQPQGFNYKFEKKLLKKFDILTQINVAPIDVLLSMKINAVFSRKRIQGRDFYDIIFLCGKTKPNYEFLNLKLGIKNQKELKQSLLEKCKELNLEQLSKDIKPLIFNSNDIKKVTLFKDFVKEVEL